MTSKINICPWLTLLANYFKCCPYLEKGKTCLLKSEWITMMATESRDARQLWKKGLCSLIQVSIQGLYQVNVTLKSFLPQGQKQPDKLCFHHSIPTLNHGREWSVDSYYGKSFKAQMRLSSASHHSMLSHFYFSRISLCLRIALKVYHIQMQEQISIEEKENENRAVCDVDKMTQDTISKEKQGSV